MPKRSLVNTLGRIPGLGIGLAGAKQTIEQHGGAITVEQGNLQKPFDVTRLLAVVAELMG